MICTLHQWETSSWLQQRVYGLLPQRHLLIIVGPIFVQPEHYLMEFLPIASAFVICRFSLNRARTGMLLAALRPMSKLK